MPARFQDSKLKHVCTSQQVVLSVTSSCHALAAAAAKHQLSLPRQLLAPHVHLMGSAVSSYSNCTADNTYSGPHERTKCSTHIDHCTLSAHVACREGQGRAGQGRAGQVSVLLATTKADVSITTHDDRVIQFARRCLYFCHVCNGQKSMSTLAA